MIEFNQVSKQYKDGTHAVESLDITIRDGEFFVLIGPSGCGKTTTLKLINRLIRASSGSILIDGKDISEYEIHELRWNIGYVLQQIALFPHMTIEENISVVPELKKWSKAKTSNRVDELLEMVGLEPSIYRRRKPKELSGGQQQRIGVARALAADPRLILMDEPFSALDPISREKLQDDVLELQRRINKTIVFVTHDMKEALKLGDRICIMKDGKVVQIGTPEEIMHHPANDFVRDFVGQQNDILNELSLEEILSPIQISQQKPPSIPLNAPLKTILAMLAEHEQIQMEKEGAAIGVLDRQLLLQYMSRSLAEGGRNHE
ncbi:MAG TPA: ABC transporter ATP-binding protein [Bacillaceae bacterium]